MSRQFLQNLEPRRLLAAGTYDVTFGFGGAMSFPFPADGSIGAITELPDGRMIVAAQVAGKLGFTRLHADGTPDVTFGSGVGVLTDINSSGQRLSTDSTGRIAVGGNGTVAVFRPDGSRDTSFWDTGVLYLSALNDGAMTADGVPHVAFEPDGNLIVAAPVRFLPDDGKGDVMVMRLGAEGDLDGHFGRNQMVALHGEVLDGLALTGGGQILVSTHYFTISDNEGIQEPVSHVQIHRLSGDGKSDEIARIGGGLDNLNVRVKHLERGADGSVVALVYDLHEDIGSYVYSLRRYAANDAAEIANFSLDAPGRNVIKADVTTAGQIIVSGYDQLGVWFTQRYTSSGRLDLSYGEVGVGTPNIMGAGAQGSGDAVVLPDGAVLIVNTRTGSDGAISDLVFVKLTGGVSEPQVTLNARGTLIFYATAGPDQIALYIRGRDGRLMARSDDFVQSFPPSRVKRMAIFAGEGDDLVNIGAGVRGAYVQGDEGNDTLFGGDFADILLGGAGNDEMHGGLASDRMLGEDGNDTMYGNGGKDLLLGGAGNDDLFGNGHDDTLDGEGGDDRLFGGGGADLLVGGPGFDVAAYDALDTRSEDIESLLT